MSQAHLGVSFALPNAAEALDVIKRAEVLGVPKVWITTATGADGLTLFAAATMATARTAAADRELKAMIKQMEDEAGIG